MRRMELITLPIAVPAFLAAQTDPPCKVGRLNYIGGPVSLRPAGVTESVEAGIVRALTTSDQVSGQFRQHRQSWCNRKIRKWQPPQQGKAGSYGNNETTLVPSPRANRAKGKPDKNHEKK